MTDLNDAAQMRPQLALELGRRGLQVRHAERVAEEFSTWVSRGHEYTWRHEPCGTQGRDWIGEQGARLEAVEHAFECEAGWLVSGGEVTLPARQAGGGAWPRRQVVPPGVWTELEHTAGSVLNQASANATVTVDADGEVTFGAPMRWRLRTP